MKNSQWLLCLFVSSMLLDHFKGKLATCDKLAIRPGECDHALEIITKLAYGI